MNERRPEFVGQYEARTPLAWAALVSCIYVALYEGVTYAHHALRRRERSMPESTRTLAWGLLRSAKSVTADVGRYVKDVEGRLSPGRPDIDASAAVLSGPEDSGER